MVSSIVPGAAGAGGALGLDPRLSRNANAATPHARETQSAADQVSVSPASIALARESVRGAMAEVQLALALGQEAQAMLVKAQDFARSGGADAQAEFDAMLASFSQRVDDAVTRGATLIAGKDISILAEPGGAPLTAPGVDLRLKDEPKPGDVMQIARDAAVDDRGLAHAAQMSLDGLQRAMANLQEVARALEAHQGFLGAAEGALKSSVRHDLDAESARLLALQVRQGLESAGARSIANAEPQAVLALFRV